MERKRADPPTLDARTALLCWNPRWARPRRKGEVLVLPWGQHRPRERDFASTTLAVRTDVQKMTFEARKKIVFIEAVHLMVRDGCDPRAVHRELLKLEEYQDGLAEDAKWEHFPDEEEPRGALITKAEEEEAAEHAAAWGDPNRALACALGEALRGLESGDGEQVREAVLVAVAAAALLPAVQEALATIKAAGP